MATRNTQAWVVPTRDDVKSILDARVVKALSPVDAGTSDTTRIDKMLSAVVLRIVGAIEAGNRTPFSGTDGSIPPEGWMHCIVLTANALCAATPGMAEYASSDAWKGQVRQANDWIDDVVKGRPVTYPADPVTSGQPQTAAWGDAQGTSDAGTAGMIDMMTDGPPIPATTP